MKKKHETTVSVAQEGAVFAIRILMNCYKLGFVRFLFWLIFVLGTADAKARKSLKF